MFEYLTQIFTSATQKCEATKTILAAPSNSIAVKIVPYLVIAENYIRELGNKVITQQSKILLSTPSELTEDSLNRNNSNPCNDLNNNNSITDIEDDGLYNYESLVAEYNTAKQDAQETVNTFLKEDNEDTEHCYDEYTNSTFILRLVEGEWIELDNI